MLRSTLYFQLILTAAYLVTSGPLYAETILTPAFSARIVQTLIDSEQNRASSGVISAGKKEVKAHIISANIYSWKFVRSITGSEVAGGAYKIEVGKAPKEIPEPELWKKILSGADKKNTPDIWARKLLEAGNISYEFIARKRIGDIAFEISLVSDDARAAEREIKERFKLFLDNAYKNGLFSPAKHAGANNFKGVWRGPMRNSKGGFASASTLIITAANERQAEGVWHAGWRFKNGKIQGDLLNFEIKGASGGCRDYKCSFKLKTPDSGVLKYEATDRCSRPAHYSGQAELKRK